MLTYSSVTIFSLSSSVWADVVVNMEDRVEVFRRDSAQITCMFESVEGIGATVIQWFYVSFIQSHAHIRREEGCVNACDVQCV